jgi:ABC-type polysaccharide/polyol phosphate export permease
VTWAPPYILAVEPLIVLFVLPVLIGIVSEVLFRDTTRASCVATFASPLVVYFCLTYRDPDGAWNWLATLLISPLAIALALAAVMVCFGRTHVRRRPQRNGV